MQVNSAIFFRGLPSLMKVRKLTLSPPQPRWQEAGSMILIPLHSLRYGTYPALPSLMAGSPAT